MQHRICDKRDDGNHGQPYNRFLHRGHRGDIVQVVLVFDASLAHSDALPRRTRLDGIRPAVELEAVSAEPPSADFSSESSPAETDLLEDTSIVESASRLHGGAEPLRAHRIEDAVAAHRSQRRGNSILQFLIARIDADAIAALGTKQGDGLHVDALDKRRIRANNRIGCDVLRFAGFDKRERRDQIGSGVQRVIAESVLNSPGARGRRLRCDARLRTLSGTVVDPFEANRATPVSM